MPDEMNKDHPEYGYIVCGSKLSKGKVNKWGINFCCARPMKAHNRCKKHGATTPKGVNSPNFKHGRHSKYMPTELLRVYDETTQDPQLLSLRAEIALMDALLAGLLPKLDTGESGKAWDTVKKLVKEVRVAYQKMDDARVMETLHDMEDLANQRILHYETHKEIKDTVDSRRRLVETETKISMQNERAISVEQLMLLMSQVLGVIQSVVTDDKQRYAIALKLQELISVPNGSANIN